MGANILPKTKETSQPITFDLVYYSDKNQPQIGCHFSLIIQVPLLFLNVFKPGRGQCPGKGKGSRLKLVEKNKINKQI